MLPAGRAAAIIINPAAFTHYAWSLHNTLAAFDGPVIEVHISTTRASPGGTPASLRLWRRARSSASASTATASPSPHSPPHLILATALHR